jgi:uncharacterized protein YfdQ (DUF2303 family)
METIKQTTEAAAVADIVAQYHEPTILSVELDEVSVPVLLAPSGFRRIEVAQKEIDEERGHPARRKGTVMALGVDAFIELVKRWANPGLIVYVSGEPRLVAVVNDHDPNVDGIAGFRDHRIEYAPELSDEWRAWTGANGKSFGQAEFSQFLEDHILDLVDPAAVGASTTKILDALGVVAATPVALRGLARDMSVRVKSQVREARNLATGETQVIFASEHSTEDGRPLTVPGAFVLGVPVFEGGPLFLIVARLRYKVVEGKIFWSFLLCQADKAKDTVLREMRERIAKETGVFVVEGTP